MTILRSCSGKAATKVFCLDHAGKEVSLPYGREMYFSAQTVSVASIYELASLLTSLESDRLAFVVRGELAPTANSNRTRRLLHSGPKGEATFLSSARPWVMIDIDGIPRPPNLGHDGLIEYLIGLLPPEFQNVTCYWQWSSSQGRKPGLRIHLWFCLNRPIPDADLKRWGNAVNAAWSDAGNSGKLIDTALFNAVQAHYTAAPLFEDGIQDPVPRRSGLRHGQVDVVALVLPEKVERARTDSAGSSHAGLGVQGHLDAIGGARGFHEPIKAAIGAYYALNGANANPDAIKSMLRHAISNADPNGRSAADIERYLSDRYLDDLIEWVAVRQAEAEEIVEPSWPLPTRGIQAIAAEVELHIGAFAISTLVKPADGSNHPRQIGIIGDCAAGKTRAIIKWSHLLWG
ncbi:hypothetical protein [Paramagnetospirillum magneticum]|uniref:hypothetical protein n=1 Tax=Paramagnetospirillum magneticum TaxID=84159 RepID=UPI0011D0FD1F|nr:hypothetical protein [Paramagnetospirillum magneticum]